MCSLFFPQQFGYTWSILMISKNQLLFHWFSLFVFCLFVLYLIDFCFSLYYFLSILSLVLICSSFSSFLWKKTNALIWDLFSFLQQSSLAIVFLLSTSLAAFHKCWYGVFSFSYSSKYFLISLFISSLSQRFFRRVLFSF